MISRQPPPLMLEDLGVDLEEDSPDFTSEEAEKSIDTEGLEDFIIKMKAFATSPVTHAELRRGGGIFYSRITLESGSQQSFKVEWIRKGAK
jgi:hypothetical protein